MSDQIVINQVGFGDDFMEINYFEIREQNDDIGIMRTIVVKTRDIEDVRADLLAGIEEVIDYALVALRNPPKKKMGGSRLRDRALQSVAPDVDDAGE